VVDLGDRHPHLHRVHVSSVSISNSARERRETLDEPALRTPVPDSHVVDLRTEHPAHQPGQQAVAKAMPGAGSGLGSRPAGDTMSRLSSTSGRPARGATRAS